MILGLAGIFLAVATPAYANSYIPWGPIAAGAQVTIGLAWSGVAFVVIVLLEGFIFARILKVSWGIGIGRALILNLISSALGAGLAAIAWEGLFVLFLGIPFTIGFLINLKSKGAPWSYIFLIVLTTIIGAYGVALVGSIYLETNPVISYIKMLGPLVFGFSTTLIYEGLWARQILDTDKPWRALLIANICSYMVLAIAIPWSPIPLTLGLDFADKYYLGDTINEGAGPDKILQIVKQRHGSNLYQLGLTDKVQLPEDYDAQVELDGIAVALNKAIPGKRFRPESAIAICDWLISLPESSEETRESAQWFKTYTEYWAKAETKAKEGDIDGLYAVIDDWDRHYMTYVNLELKPGGVQSPLSVLMTIDAVFDLGLEIPEFDELDEAERERYSIESDLPADPFGALGGGEDEVSTSQ